jgi:sulfate adenylyltransferase subunit 1 (EFTu-like GTPase family)
LSKALYFDAYSDNKSNGAFILIDAATNTTAGVGFIINPIPAFPGGEIIDVDISLSVRELKMSMLNWL